MSYKDIIKIGVASSLLAAAISASAASCLTGSMTLGSGANTWYAPVTLTIANGCSAPQNLNGLQVGFSNNGAPVSSVWGAYSANNFSQNGFTLTGGNDPLAVGASAVINFGVNLSGTAFNLSAANSSLTFSGASAGTTTPVTPPATIPTTVPPATVIDTPAPASTCLKGAFTNLSAAANTWYTGATLQVTNNCGTAIDLNNASVAFNSNSVTSTGGPYYPLVGSTSTVANGVVNFTMQAASGVQTSATTLANGASMSLPVGLNLNGKVFDLSNANTTVKITTAAAAMPTPNNGVLTVVVNPAGVTGLPSGTTESIQITSNALAQPIVINNTNWTTSQTYSYSSLGYATYTIAPTDIAGYTAMANPTTVTVNSSTPNVVNISYKAIPAQGSVSVTLPAKPISTLTDTAETVNVTDTVTGQVQSQTIAFGQKATFSALTAGDTIQVSTPVLSDGIQTATPAFSMNNFKVTANATQNVNVTFQVATNPTSPVPFQVTGLTTAVPKVNVTFTNLQGNRIGPVQLGNGATTVQLPNNTYTVDVDATPLASMSNSPDLSVPVAAGKVVNITVSQPIPVTTIFSPYMDVTLDADWNNNQPGDLTSYLQTTGVKSLNLAFIVDSGTCQAAWGGYSSMPATGTTPWGLTWFNNMRAQGVSYIISFGGAAGSDLSEKCSNQQLVQIYQNVIDTYKPKVLDFDIEGHLVANAVAYKNIIAALKTIQANNPNLLISFTLPVLPDGIPAGGSPTQFPPAANTGMDVVYQAAKAGLNFKVNIMTMDYGSETAFPGDMMEKHAEDAIDALANQLAPIYPNKTATERYNMIGAIPMIGINDVVTERFTLAQATGLLKFSQNKGLYLISMWSVGRDKSCNSPWASPSCSGAYNGVLMQTNTGDFGKAFMGK